MLHGCFCFFGGVPATAGRKQVIVLFLDADGNAVHAGAHGILEIVLTHVAGIHLHGDLCRVRNTEMLRERLHQSCELRFGERRGCAAPQIDGIAEAILKVRAFEIHFLGKCINVAVGGLSSNRIEAAVITAASAKRNMDVQTEGSADYLAALVFTNYFMRHFIRVLLLGLRLKKGLCMTGD